MPLVTSSKFTVIRKFYYWDIRKIKYIEIYGQNKNENNRQNNARNIIIHGLQKENSSFKSDYLEKWRNHSTEGSLK